MNVIIETDRLLLRKFVEDDDTLLYELHSDPDVAVYTLDRMTHLEEAKIVINEVILPQYNLYNHGRWAVNLKDGLQFIGWCGLKYMAERNEVDIGYRFMKKFWGQGYATEAAFASLKYGFDKLDIKQIVGRTLPANLASIKVLEKCGMKYIGEDYIDELLHKTYIAINPAIRQ